MARSLMAKCLALAAAAVALFALPSAFVPARQGAPAVSPAVAAGVAAGTMALPAWAYDMPDAQILLARVPGGKRTKELGLVVPIPEEDGLTDGQIAALFVVALVGLIAAVDLAKTLYFGINPTKFKTAKGKGSITPFMKRLIENGYWAVVRMPLNQRVRQLPVVSFYLVSRQTCHPTTAWVFEGKLAKPGPATCANRRVPWRNPNLGLIVAHWIATARGDSLELGKSMQITWQAQSQIYTSRYKIYYTLHIWCKLDHIGLRYAILYLVSVIYRWFRWPVSAWIAGKVLGTCCQMLWKLAGGRRVKWACFIMCINPFLNIKHTPRNRGGFIDIYRYLKIFIDIYRYL